jgi:prepilin-type N-terminal cleavage/methylation domain-containing protein
MPSLSIPDPRHQGFTLIEMAIVLLILSLLLGGGLAVLGAQIDQQRVKDSTTLLTEAQEALLGYAASHVDASGRPYLPCPDKTAGGGAGTANDGQEDRTVATGACVNQEGNLPWVTLGLAGTDSWGNRLRYRVEAVFSNSLTGMQLASTGALRVNDAAGAALVTTAPVVMLSHGKNGRGARNASGGANAAPTGANELENTDTDGVFVANSPVGTGGTGGEFDDLTVWLSPHLLFNRMIQAGRLP